MASQEGPLVLSDEWACACAEDGNLGLDILDVVVIGFEIDLESKMSAWGRPCSAAGPWTYMLDGNDLSSSLLNSLVDNTETSTYRRSQELSAIDQLAW